MGDFFDAKIGKAEALFFAVFATAGGCSFGVHVAFLVYGTGFPIWTPPWGWSTGVALTTLVAIIVILKGIVGHEST